MVPNKDDIAWAAGLFEGEGCISVGSKRRPTHAPRVSLSTTDEDVVRRFAVIVRCGRVSGPHRKGKYKPFWLWKTGTFEHFQYIVCLLWYWLCNRRRQRAKEILFIVGPIKSGLNKTHCPHGHEYSEGNTKWGMKRGHKSRYCVICHRTQNCLNARRRRANAI